MTRTLQFEEKGVQKKEKTQPSTIPKITTKTQGTCFAFNLYTCELHSESTICHGLLRLGPPIRHFTIDSATLRCFSHRKKSFARKALSYF